jgi:peptidoglycan LD-endopeptidase CwlK
MAADIAPWPVDYSQREEFTLLAGLVLGTSHQMLKNGEITHRVRWGGDWDSDYDLDDNKFDDLPHFELVEVT